VGGGSKAEPTRSLARLEQRIEELCQRIDKQPIVDESPLNRDRQASGQAQPSTGVNELKRDVTNVLSSALNQKQSNHPVLRRQRSESVSASSDDVQLLPTRETGSFELHKGVFYGQSLLPSLSPLAPIEENPGRTLLDILGAPNDSSAEVRYSTCWFQQDSCQMPSAMATEKI
jgi:hypothetical protein